MGELLLGIDIGTYSSKAALVQPDGTIPKTATVPHTGLVEPGSIDARNPTRTVLRPTTEHRALHDERYRELCRSTREVVHGLG